MSTLEAAAAYIAVVFIGQIGGSLVDYSNYKQDQYRIKLAQQNKTPSINLKMADLTGFMFFGCITRNLPFKFMDQYPDKLASYMQCIPTAIIFLRLGMSLQLNRNIRSILLLTFLPFILEMITAAFLVSEIIPGMTFLGGIAFGAYLPSVGAAALCQNQLYFIENKKGIDQFLPQLLIAACSIENILSLILFGFFAEIYFASENPNTGNIVIQCILQLVYVISGFVLGILLGYGLIFLRKINNSTIQMVVLQTLVIVSLIVTKYLELINISFSFILTFAYVASNYSLVPKNQIQKECVDRSKKYIAISLRCCKVLLFSNVGAQLVFKDITSEIWANSFIVIAVTGLVRAITCYTQFYHDDFKLNRKERLFLAGSWFPKGTVQGAFGGLCYIYAQQNNIDRLNKVGYFWAKFASIIMMSTIPLGSIMSLNMGEAWLQKSLYSPTIELSEQVIKNNQQDQIQSKDNDQSEQTQQVVRIKVNANPN